MQKHTKEKHTYIAVGDFCLNMSKIGKDLDHEYIVLNERSNEVVGKFLVVEAPKIVKRQKTYFFKSLQKK